MTSETAKLFDLFQRNAARELMLDVRNDERVTYGAFLERSLRLGTLLAEQGLRQGDSIVVSMENCVELGTLIFAAWHVGARVVPINPAYHVHEYASILERVQPRLFVVSAAVYARLGTLAYETSGGKVLCVQPAVEPLRSAHAPLVNIDLPEALSRCPVSPRTLAAAGNDEVCLVMFTSGTTGVPKGIEIRFGGLLANGAAFVEGLGLRAESRFYNILSMSYLGGLYNLMLIPILAEGWFALDAPFGPSNQYGFWETARTQGVNTLWFSPTILSMLLALDDEEDLSFLRAQIRVGICGMAPLPVDLKQRFESRFGFALYENYGLSETTFVTSAAPGWPHKPGSVGRPVRGVEVRVLDSSGCPVPVGHEGQIAVRSPYLMRGYDNPGPAERATMLASGEFATGDVGYLDRDGDLFLTGRLKDIIIRGGINISPKVIEDTVYRMEAVQEAAVVGTPHSVYGEEVALVVRLRDSHRQRVSAEDLQRFCDAQIAHFQRPKMVFLIDDMPKGVTGKIHKGVLRRMLQEKLNPLHG